MRGSAQTIYRVGCCLAAESLLERLAGGDGSERGSATGSCGGAPPFSGCRHWLGGVRRRRDRRAHARCRGGRAAGRRCDGLSRGDGRHDDACDGTFDAQLPLGTGRVTRCARCHVTRFLLSESGRPARSSLPRWLLACRRPSLREDAKKPLLPWPMSIFSVNVATPRPALCFPCISLFVNLRARPSGVLARESRRLGARARRSRARAALTRARELRSPVHLPLTRPRLLP